MQRCVVDTAQRSNDPQWGILPPGQWRSRGATARSPAPPTTTSAWMTTWSKSASTTWTGRVEIGASVEGSPFQPVRARPEVLEIVDLPDPHPGPGQVRIAVRAASVNPSDWKKRKGLMDAELPQTLDHEAAGVVDEFGEEVADVAVGDRVFGVSAEGAAQAELAVLSCYAPIPPSLDFPGAAALPAAIETATRALGQLGVGSGSTLLINGASGRAAALRSSSPRCAARA